jgi:ssDNA-binding Zn-finger/Zn-ribbon topoisomerase 1
MQEIVKCPKCHKRIFDLEWRDRTIVKTKCIHCRNIVAIKRERAGLMKQSPKRK